MRFRAALPLVAIATATLLVGFAPLPKAPVPAQATTYEIDSVHSTALFRVLHAGAGQFWGRFNTIDGTFNFGDEGEDSALSIDVAIPIESVDTNHDGLDRHLKSPDFFNAREFATMTFKSTSVEKVDDRNFAVTGDLTIRGTTKSIVANVEWTGSSENDRGGKRCGIEAKFMINRSEFGVEYGISRGSLGDEVRIIVALEGVAR